MSGGERESKKKRHRVLHDTKTLNESHAHKKRKKHKGPQTFVFVVQSDIRKKERKKEEKKKKKTTTTTKRRRKRRRRRVLYNSKERERERDFLLRARRKLREQRLREEWFCAFGQAKNQSRI